ncbi:MAG: acyl-CoA dehydrogenase family protein, partial [Gemmatimonadota bacterium]
MPTAEQVEIRALAREFAEGEIRPRSMAWDEARRLDDEVFAKLGELGFLGMLVSEEHGGLGFDLSTYLLVLEELARGDAAVALSVAIHSVVSWMILRHGTMSQRETWAERLASGDALGASRRRLLLPLPSPGRRRRFRPRAPTGRRRRGRLPTPGALPTSPSGTRFRVGGPSTTPRCGWPPTAL